MKCWCFYLELESKSQTLMLYTIYNTHKEYLFYWYILYRLPSFISALTLKMLFLKLTICNARMLLKYLFVIFYYYYSVIFFTLYNLFENLFQKFDGWNNGEKCDIRFWQRLKLRLLINCVYLYYNFVEIH